jgi:hypothetical protein
VRGWSRSSGSTFRAGSGPRRHRRIREPKLAGEIEWRPFPGIWGLKSLPITFTPA